MLFERLKFLQGLAGTLRFRLMLWTTLVVILMVAITLLIVRAVVSRTLYYEFDQVLIADLRDISKIVQIEPSENKLIAQLERLTQRTHVYPGWFVQVLSEQGKVIWSSELTPEELPLIDKKRAARRTIDLKGSRFLEAYVPRERDKLGPSYFLRVGSSNQAMVDDTELLDRVMWLASFLMFLVTPLGAYILASRATRTLGKIISTASRLQPGALEERLPIRGNNDELDQLATTVNGMLDRIASYLNKNRDFIAHAAHELRSPLTAIRSSVEVALNRSRTPEEYQSLLSDVVEECARLGELVNRLLLLAEGDAGRLRVEDQTVRLDRIAKEAVDMFHAVAESQGIELVADRLDETVVIGDEYHLRQVIRNLVDNAIKFTMPPGSVKVHLRAERTDMHAYLSITDSGMGIAPEHQERIFDRFYRVDRSRQREAGRGGYGLGLSICQAIVQAQGGEISLITKPGVGSTFTVQLPLAPAPTTPLVAIV